MMGNPGMGGLGGFPAPGLPSNAQGQGTAGSTTAPQAGTTAPTPPFGLFNPFGIPPPATSGTAAAHPPGGGGLFGDPALMQQMLGAFGGGGLGGAPATPADARPPEERFQVQLQVS